MIDFVRLLATVPAAESDSWLQTLLHWADAESPWQLGLVAFGLIAQCLFFGRWIIQVVATERRKESHIPEMFWWMSLSGASMLFVYFLLRGEPVGLIGQSVGWTVYIRNLHHIRRNKRRMRKYGTAHPNADKKPT